MSKTGWGIVLLIVVIGVVGLYYLSTINYPYSLKLTHNSKPLVNITVSLCLKYCQPQTLDFKQGGTDVNGIVTLSEGPLTPPDGNYIFQFIYNGTGYTIHANEGALVDDPI